MDTKVNYTVVGFFMVALVVAAVFIFLWLTSLRHKDVEDVYVTYMREEVSGLNVQSAVRFNGVKVGYVSSIKLNPKDPQQVLIILKIKDKTPVSTSTIATLMSEGITGLDYVGLKALTPNAPLLTAKPGQRYPVIPSEPSLLMKLSTAVQKVTSSIAGLSQDVRKVFDEKNREALARTLSNLQVVTHSVAINSQQISSSIKASNKLLTNSAQASQALPKVMAEIEATLKAIKATAKTLNTTGSSVSHTMGQTQITMQNISHQVVPSTQQLLQKLNGLVTTLQKVGNELAQNPSVIIRGAAPAPPGPGERQ